MSLAIGVFTQQSIQAVPCDRPVSGLNVSLAIGNRTAQIPIYRPGAALYEIDPTVKINIINSLTNPAANRTVSTIGCTTGNCTFENVNGITHSFAGVCSKCVDTTSGISLWYDSNSSNPISPWVLNATGGMPAINVGGQSTFVSLAGSLRGEMDFEILSPEIQSALPFALANISMISVTLDGCTVNTTSGSETPQCSSRFRNELPDESFFEYWNVISTFCVVYPCIQNSFADVKNGKFTEITRNEIVMHVDGISTSPVQNYINVNKPCIIDGIQYDQSNYTRIPSWSQHSQTLLNGQLEPTDCVYSLYSASAWGLSEFLQTLFSGRCGLASNAEIGALFEQKWTLCNVDSENSSDAIWLQSMFNNANATFQSIDIAMNSMATAISDSFRLQGAYGSIWDDYLDNVTDVGGNLSRPAILNGTISQIKVCIQVNWRWLSLPACLVGLTAVLLLNAIITSRLDRQKLPIWKSSILPLLYSTPGMELFTTSASLTGLGKDAEKRTIRLIKADDRWEFEEIKNSNN